MTASTDVVKIATADTSTYLSIGTAVRTTAPGNSSTKKANKSRSFVNGNVLQAGQETEAGHQATLDPRFFNNPNVGLLMSKQKPAPPAGTSYEAKPKPLWMLMSTADSVIVNFE